MPDTVHEDALIPFHLEFRLCFEKLVNNLCLDFHDFGFGFGFDGGFRVFTVSEIIGVDDISQSSNEVEIIVLFLNTAGDDDMDRVDEFALFDDFFAFFIGFLNGLHSDLDDLITGKIGKQGTISEDIIEPNLISLELTKMNINNAPVNFLPKILKLALINEPLLIILL